MTNDIDPERESQATAKDLIENPQANFPAPAEVVADDRLSAKEKTEALKTWELDAKLEAVAAEEGMTGGTAPELDEIKKAQAKLPAETPAAPVSPSKTG